MDSVTQLALISKAKKVFESSDTILSFPVTPLAYKKTDFDLFSQTTADVLRRSKENLSSFSKLVNLIPISEAWMPTGANFLWDEYEYVLTHGIPAFSSRTPQEEEIFQKAKAYLRIEDEEGVMRPSQQVQEYSIFRDAYFMAQQEYMEGKVSAEATDDEAEQRRWSEIDEPAFRARLEELESNWVLEGFKNEVEIAQYNFKNLGAKSPTLTWSEWQAQFNPDIDSQTNANDLSEVFPSSFTPPNALEEGSWASFSLTEAEIKTLVDEAPSELRRRFMVENTVSSIKSMTLEFSSARIIRPWFDKDLFSSRFWRLTDETKVISDGGTPPSGDCPVFVTAIVFARKVVVEQKQAQPNSPRIMFTNDLRFNYAVKNQNTIQPISPAVIKAMKPKRMTIQPVRMQPMRARPVQPHMVIKNRTTNAAPASTPVSRSPHPRSRGRAHVVANPDRANLLSSRAMLNLRASTFTRLPIQPIKAPALRLPEPSSAPAAREDESIYVLAFICKSVPKCPDPDPSLDWGDG